MAAAGSTAPWSRLAPGFQVRLAGGSTLHASRILVATGLRDKLPDIPGVRERWGRDLLHCPYCHGYEVRDQPLGVLGAPLKDRRFNSSRAHYTPLTADVAD